MKMNLASLLILAGTLLTTVLFAQSGFERELAALDEQHDKTVAAAIRQYQTSLRELMRRAMQSGDIDIALEASERLASLQDAEEPAKPKTGPLIGKWTHRSSSGFLGEDEFLPNGEFRTKGRSGTWKQVGSHIETSVENYHDYYKLPPRNGKLYGVNKSGSFSIVLTAVPKG